MFVWYVSLWLFAFNWYMLFSIPIGKKKEKHPAFKWTENSLRLSPNSNKILFTKTGVRLDIDHQLWFSHSWSTDQKVWGDKYWGFVYSIFCFSRTRTFIFVQAKVGVWARALPLMERTMPLFQTQGIQENLEVCNDNCINTHAQMFSSHVFFHNKILNLAYQTSRCCSITPSLNFFYNTA